MSFILSLPVASPSGGSSLPSVRLQEQQDPIANFPPPAEELGPKFVLNLSGSNAVVQVNPFNVVFSAASDGPLTIGTVSAVGFHPLSRIDTYTYVTNARTTSSIRVLVCILPTGEVQLRDAPGSSPWSSIADSSDTLQFSLIVLSWLVV
jgi:hypothetical protein